MSKSIKSYTDEISKTTNNAAAWYKKNTRTFWILVWLFLVAWLATCIYVSHNPKVPVEGIKKPDKEIIHDVQVVLDDKTVDSLKKIIAKKDLIVKDYKTKWLAAVAKNKANAEWVETIDTIPIDWKEKARDLTQDAVNSDSLCRDEITALESKSVVQDSVIQAQDKDKRSIISSFNELAYNSGLKDNVIKQKDFQLRKKNVKGIVKDAVIVGLILKAFVFK